MDPFYYLFYFQLVGPTSCYAWKVLFEHKALCIKKVTVFLADVIFLW